MNLINKNKLANITLIFLACLLGLSVWAWVQDTYFACKSITTYDKAHKLAQEILAERAERVGLKSSDFKQIKYENINGKKWYFVFEGTKYGRIPIAIYPNCYVDTN